MPRQALLSLAAALTFSSAGAFAQSGELSGVTMRVLDSLDDVDTVLLSLDANRAAAATAADAAADTSADADDAAAARERASPEAAAGEQREREALHDTEVDERSEGRLEDRDVAERVVAAPAVP